MLYVLSIFVALVMGYLGRVEVEWHREFFDSYWDTWWGFIMMDHVLTSLCLLAVGLVVGLIVRALGWPFTFMGKEGKAARRLRGDMRQFKARLAGQEELLADQAQLIANLEAEAALASAEEEPQPDQEEDLEVVLAGERKDSLEERL